MAKRTLDQDRQSRRPDDTHYPHHGDRIRDQHPRDGDRERDAGDEEE